MNWIATHPAAFVGIAMIGAVGIIFAIGCVAARGAERPVDSGDDERALAGRRMEEALKAGHVILTDTPKKEPDDANK